MIVITSHDRGGDRDCAGSLTKTRRLVTTKYGPQSAGRLVLTVATSDHRSTRLGTTDYRAPAICRYRNTVYRSRNHCSRPQRHRGTASRQRRHRVTAVQLHTQYRHRFKIFFFLHLKNLDYVIDSSYSVGNLIHRWRFVRSRARNISSIGWWWGEPNAGYRKFANYSERPRCDILVFVVTNLGTLKLITEMCKLCVLCSDNDSGGFEP